jgi:hypothetical protein
MKSTAKRGTMARRHELDLNRASAWGLVTGQCSQFRGSAGCRVEAGAVQAAELKLGQIEIEMRKVKEGIKYEIESFYLRSRHKTKPLRREKVFINNKIRS